MLYVIGLIIAHCAFNLSRFYVSFMFFSHRKTRIIGCHGNHPRELVQVSVGTLLLCLHISITYYLFLISGVTAQLIFFTS